ncbi:MAG TPA: ROK family protein [Candidatus Limnocylindrales bacterium]|jgi:polyphosphate glucokinase
MIGIGVDVGGSGIKVGAADLVTGTLVSERLQEKTPNPSTPDRVVEIIATLVGRVAPLAGAAAPVGIGVPCVVLDGVTKTAANIDQAWIDFDADRVVEGVLRRPVRVVNDADAAGLAEMRFGAGRGKRGVVLMLTLGTGVGSALFTDGHLVPNTELGHLEIRGADAEDRSAAAVKTRESLSWEAWAALLDEHIRAIDRILWPDLIILGGGVSRDADRFIPLLTARPPIVAATLENDAGIVGAALAAAERLGP